MLLLKYLTTDKLKDTIIQSEDEKSLWPKVGKKKKGSKGEQKPRIQTDTEARWIFNSIYPWEAVQA